MPHDAQDMPKNKPLAEVRLACGRKYLSVGGIALAMETDVCRDVHFFESRWTVPMLEQVAAKINEAAENS